MKSYATVMSRVGLVTAMALLSASLANGATLTLRVAVENLSPSNGMYMSSVWGGFHDGTFDLFDSGSAASSALESIAEDGNFTPAMTAFSGASGTYSQGMTSFPPPQAPGETRMFDITIDDSNPTYFSYAAMLVPSNDAFIANDLPTAYMVVDGSGNFIPQDFTLAGLTDVWDAGTEVNDEVPMNTAFFGQSTPNTGDDQGGVVSTHGGHIPGGNILSDAMFMNADFNQAGYNVARITVTEVPEPETYAALAGVLSLGLALWHKRRKGKAL